MKSWLHRATDAELYDAIRRRDVGVYLRCIPWDHSSSFQWKFDHILREARRRGLVGWGG